MVGCFLSLSLLSLSLSLSFALALTHACGGWQVMKPVLERAKKKTAELSDPKKRFLLLAAFVGIPLPGTGAWTGAMGAFLVGMPFAEVKSFAPQDSSSLAPPPTHAHHSLSPPRHHPLAPASRCRPSTHHSPPTPTTIPLFLNSLPISLPSSYSSKVLLVPGFNLKGALYGF